MGKISDFFKRIFRRQPKMLNSGEKEASEEVSASQNKFKDELKKQAEISNIDPRRYQDEKDLYMAILEELGVSPNFKNNPRAKKDLIGMVEDIKRPDNVMLIEMKKDEEYSKFLMDLLSMRIKVNKEGNEIKYLGSYIPYNSLGSQRLTKVFSILENNYIQNEHYMSTEYDHKQNIDIIKRFDKIHTYDENGIEIKKEKLYFKNIETEPKKIDVDGETYPYVYDYAKIEDKFLESKETMTRLSYINNTQRNNLSDFLTVQYTTDQDSDGTYSINLPLKGNDGYENIDDLYTLEQKRKLDKFHNLDGTSSKKEDLERKINNSIRSREARGYDCSILKNYMAPIMEMNKEEDEILEI